MRNASYIGQRIKEARGAEGMNQEELGEKFGVQKAHISRIENGKVELKMSDLDKFAKILNKPRSYFLPPEQEPELRPLRDALSDLAQKLKDLSDRADQSDEKQPPPHARVPHYIQTAALGENGKLAEDRAAIDFYFMYPEKDWKPSLGTITAEGNCLTGKIDNGDIVWFDTALTPSNGDYVVCSHQREQADEWEVGVKRFRHVNDHAFLEDNNQSYSVDDCRVIGVVTGVFRGFKV